MSEQSATVKKGIYRYFGEYNVKDMAAMIRNNKKSPEICETPFKGKFVIITGATSGIGYHTAHKYGSMGAELLLINRNREKSEKLCQNLKDAYSIKCNYLLTDFSDLNQVRDLAETILKLNRKIDVLIHNAGVYFNRRVETAQGLETVFAVNHLSSFLLNELLLPLFKKQKSGRIIMVNSEGHRFAMWGLRTDDLNWKKRHYSGLGSYGSAKLAQLLTMKVFAEQLEGSGVTINAMHPGAVKTESGKENDEFYKWYKEKIIERKFRSAGLSSEALYYLGASEEISLVNGKFFNLTTIETPAPPALDKAAADEIFEISREMVHFTRSNKKMEAEETVHP
ncbi:MAG: SDR family NAD(P)-dependent oxidoreductase [Spirochaetales bacterium]|nr:SDR family NAD(P)-dependent oxidoreductase [Spirochaetales bacterium]